MCSHLTAHQHKIGYLLVVIKDRLIKPKLIANIKKVQQRLYASIKMGIFDKSNYIVNTGIIEQVFQCTASDIVGEDD